MAVIEIKKIQKSFGHLEVLKSVDFSVNQGEVVCLIGASGSGKSTLLRCINLLETPDGGEIIVHGEDIMKVKNANSYRSKVGMVFQSFNLFNNMTVLKNCMVAQMKVLKRSEAEAKEIAENNKEKEEHDKTIADDKNDNGKEYPINMPPLPNKEKNVD